MSYDHRLIFVCLFFTFLVFSPNFPSQIPVTTAMQISNTILYHASRLGTIKDVGSLVKWHIEHLAYADNDSGTLGTSQYLFAFVTHSCSLPINVRHSCNILPVRMQY